MKEELFNNLISSTGALSITDVLINFLAACVISILLFVSYKISHSSPVYSKRFNVSLVMLVLITTLIMNVIGNNIALSLGMVGALSIVRFRTAIKDPRDTAYIFWAIAVGVCCGVSDYLIAGIGSVIIFLFLILFGFVHDNERIMVVVKMNSDTIESLESTMDSYFSGKAMLRLCNSSVEEGYAEAIYEVSDAQMAEGQKVNGETLIKMVSGLEGVKSVSLVRQDDEINQ